MRVNEQSAPAYLSQRRRTDSLGQAILQRTSLSNDAFLQILPRMLELSARTKEPNWEYREILI